MSHTFHWVSNPKALKKARHGVNTFYRPSNKPKEYVGGQGTFSRSALANNYSAVTEKQVVDCAGTAGTQQQVEPFYSVSSGGLVGIGATGTFCVSGTLVGVPQGSGQGQRQGRMINVTGIHVEGYALAVNTLITATTKSCRQKIRIFLLLDRQANGELPPQQYVLDQIFSSGWLSMANPNYAKRRIVVLDSIDMNLGSVGESFLAGPPAVSDPLASRHYFKFDLNCSIPIEYNNTAGTLNELRSNNLLLFAVADPAGGATISCTSRVCFVG